MMSQDLRYEAGPNDDRTRREDEQVFNELERALRDLSPLLAFNTQQEPERYIVTTTSRLTLTGSPLNSEAPLRLP